MRKQQIHITATQALEGGPWAMEFVREGFDNYDQVVFLLAGALQEACKLKAEAASRQQFVAPKVIDIARG